MAIPGDASKAEKEGEKYVFSLPPVFQSSSKSVIREPENRISRKKAVNISESKQ